MIRLLLLIALAVMAGPGPAGAEAELTPAKDLAALGERAEREGKPLVVFFYQEQCHYCEAVREEYLRPMEGDPETDRRILLRKVDIRGDGLLKDFEGEEVRQEGFAQAQEQSFTPTIAFYGPDGQRLAAPLVGLKGGRDFYGHYLEKGIEKAEAALQEQL